MKPRISTTIVAALLTLALRGEDKKMSAAIDDRLKSTFSKVAPLEKWEVSWLGSGPRICWRFFRANPERERQLLHAIDAFRGYSRWQYPGGCLQPGGTTFITTVPTKFFTQPDSPASSTRPAPSLTTEQALSDLGRLADHIEARLSLENVEPKTFSEELLSKEGLRHSRGPFEDFEDGGQRPVFLMAKPEAGSRYEPEGGDILLHFAPFDHEFSAILAGILRVEPSLLENRALTQREAEKVQNGFPLIWRISDYYEDAYLSPTEAGLLYRECEMLDKAASSPAAIRGLDKLLRVAHWASSKNYGILFSAP